MEIYCQFTLQSKTKIEGGLNYDITDIRTNTQLDLAKINNFNQSINIYPKDDIDCPSKFLNRHYRI